MSCVTDVTNIGLEIKPILQKEAESLVSIEDNKTRKLSSVPTDIDKSEQIAQTREILNQYEQTRYSVQEEAQNHILKLLQPLDTHGVIGQFFEGHQRLIEERDAALEALAEDADPSAVQDIIFKYMHDSYELYTENSIIYEDIQSRVERATQGYSTLSVPTQKVFQVLLNHSTKAGGRLLDRCLGCMLGFLVGNAFGSQFQGLSVGEIGNQMQAMRTRDIKGSVITAMRPTERDDSVVFMPGQISDAGNMTLCLARSLLPYEIYENNLTAQTYLMWWNAGSFYMPPTLVNAFGDLTAAPPTAHPYDQITSRSRKLNADSYSNTALMRIVPLVLATLLQADEVRESWVSKDTSLTNPSLFCTDASLTLARFLQVLIMTGDSRVAYDSLDPKTIGVKKLVADAAESLHVHIKRPGTLELEWDLQNYAGPNHDFLGFGLVPAINMANGLRTRSFQEAVEKVTSLGGDTSVNAALVGAAMGAKLGLGAMPCAWLFPVMTSDQHESVRTYNDLFNNLGSLVDIIPLTVSLVNMNKAKKGSAKRFRNPVTAAIKKAARKVKSAVRVQRKSTMAVRSPQADTPLPPPPTPSPSPPPPPTTQTTRAPLLPSHEEFWTEDSYSPNPFSSRRTPETSPVTDAEMDPFAS
jgi:ADP-ribosylglycohydrolase